MTNGSSPVKPTEDHASPNREKKVQQSQSSSAVAKTDAKPKITGSKQSVAGEDGLLHVLDDDSDEFLASYASPNVDAEESKKGSVDCVSEEPTLCLHIDDSDPIKGDEAVAEENIKSDKKDLTNPAATAAASSLIKPTKPSAERTILIKSKMIWVYNILPSTKASELKTHFSKHAKITTARVVTNGRKYYGCLTVEDEDSVKECIKQLNKTTIDGQEIKVQASAPDNENDPPEDPKKEKRPPPRERRKAVQEKPDPLTRVVRSPKSKSQTNTKSRRRSRSNSFEIETRQKVVELRRLTADIEDLQRRKERLILEEKEKERERRENERIQEMRRKMEEERAHKRMEIELDKKKLDLERKLLEKERVAFMKLRTIEMEEIRIRADTKRKLEEVEEYQRKVATKKDRKHSPASPKRYNQRSPNLYQSSQKFDIKPLKRETQEQHDEKYPPAPKISSSPIAYNHKSSSDYYNHKENRYSKYSSISTGTKSSSPSKHGGKAEQQHLTSYGHQAKTNSSSSWLPSSLSTISSNNYRQQGLNDHHHSHGGAALNLQWQQMASGGGGNSSSSGGKQQQSRYGTAAEPQQQQQHQHTYRGVQRVHQYGPGPPLMDNGGKGAGRNQGGVYQGGRRY